MGEQTDEQLMLDFQRGDDNAVQIIFKRYKSPLLNFSLRILGNRADAEDVTSDVFLTLFDRKYTFHPEAKFSTWLFTVTRNRCLSQLRKKKGISSLWFYSKEDETSKPLEIEDAHAFSKADLEEKEMGVLIQQAIQRIPLEQKEALVLREYHQMSYDEISQVLDCSLEKIKILIFRAREKLRQELTPFIEEGTQ